MPEQTNKEAVKFGEKAKDFVVKFSDQLMTWHRTHPELSHDDRDALANSIQSAADELSRIARETRTAEEGNAEDIAVITAALVDAIKANDPEIIRQAGEDLNGLGGDALMRRTFNEVVEPYDEPEYGRVVNLIDRAWHGVGHWLA